MGINEIQGQDFDIEYTLTSAPERVGGFFYLGSPTLLKEYQQLYHDVCAEFHKNNIVDDDQHIMIRCVKTRPDLFKVWYIGWHATYLYFV